MLAGGGARLYNVYTIIYIVVVYNWLSFKISLRKIPRKKLILVLEFGQPAVEKNCIQIRFDRKKLQNIQFPKIVMVFPLAPWNRIWKENWSWTLQKYKNYCVC